MKTARSKQRLFVIDTNPRAPKLVGEFDTLAKAKVAAKGLTKAVITEKDDLKVVSDKVKIKLISAWRGDSIENVRPVALDYRVMNLLTHWAGNRKIKLGEKTMAIPAKKKVAPKKTPVKKKVAVKKAPVKKPVVKKKVAAKKAPVKKPTATKSRSKVEEKAFVAAVKRHKKAKMTLSECYKALRDEFGISAISPLMKRFDLTYE